MRHRFAYTSTAWLESALHIDREVGVMNDFHSKQPTLGPRARGKWRPVITLSIGGSSVKLIIEPIIKLILSSTIIMPGPRKSKRPADTPVSTSISPADLVQDLTSQRSSIALAATSAAIALSIGSAFSDTRDTSIAGATVGGRDVEWQTAYAAVRMAVETIKESSDLCLPLKAVVGAISALMKNYDVSVSC